MVSLRRLFGLLGTDAPVWWDRLRSPAGGGKGPVKLLGAGASFPAPLYATWFSAYHAAHPDVQIDYQSVTADSGVRAT